MRLHTLIEGTVRTISCLEKSNGRRPAEAFLRRSLGEKEQGRVAQVLSIFADQRDPRLPPTRIKKLSGQAELWELKEKQARIFYFHHGRNVVLILGVTKKQGRHRPKDLRRAAGMKEQFLNTIKTEDTDTNGKHRLV